MKKRLPLFYALSVPAEINLHLCRQLMLAGFPASRGGRLAFTEIDVGDLVTFLFEGEFYDLFEVERKICLRDDIAKNAGPWPVRDGVYGRIYFPYRLALKPVRIAAEPVSLLRPETGLFAKSLFKIANFWKTHYQLSRESLALFRGIPTARKLPPLSPYRDVPDWQEGRLTFTLDRKKAGAAHGPFHFDELALQVRIKSELKRRAALPASLGGAEIAEVLREHPMRSGVADIAITHPDGTRTILEIKRRTASAKKGGTQILRYMTEEKNVACGVLLAEKFSADILAAPSPRLRLVGYEVLAHGERFEDFEIVLKPAGASEHA